MACSPAGVRPADGCLPDGRDIRGGFVGQDDATLWTEKLLEGFQTIWDVVEHVDGQHTIYARVGGWQCLGIRVGEVHARVGAARAPVLRAACRARYPIR